MNKKETIYQPKGGMCYACKKVNEDCSGLDFSSMPVHQKMSDGRVIVICKEMVKV